MIYICSKVIEKKCNVFGCNHHFKHHHTGVACDNGTCSRHKDKTFCRVPCVPIDEFLKKEEFEI